MLGETLEIHCENEFNGLRATAFPNAYFDKDNEVIGGSKGDYIFRDYDSNGTEFISIMFEMKNEGDTTATKKKNEDFLEKLDKDRNNKGCEFAILVSVLESDNIIQQWNSRQITSISKHVCNPSTIFCSNDYITKKCCNKVYSS